MRLWSIHPSYVDSKGLVATWREGLLALHVLSGNTKGYINHPQLIRFKQQEDPVQAITNYLHAIVDEAEKRSYNFKREKLLPYQKIPLIPVTTDQIKYESEHLLSKLKKRDHALFLQHQHLKEFLPHPVFTIIPGPIEKWEKV